MNASRLRMVLSSWLAGGAGGLLVVLACPSADARPAGAGPAPVLPWASPAESGARLVASQAPATPAPGREQKSRGPAPLFPVEARIVWIDVVAADAGDHPVRDLAVEEFEVLEAGVRRPIVLFMPPESQASGRAIAFLVDDSVADARQLNLARDVVKRMLAKVEPGDRVLLIAPASRVGASLEIPTGRRELEAQLERIQSHPQLGAARADAELARRLNRGRVEAVAAALSALEGHSGPRALVVVGPPLPFRADSAHGAVAYERIMRASERAAAPVYFFQLEEQAADPPALTRPPDWVTGARSVVGVAPLLPMAPGETARPGSPLLDAVASDSGGFSAPSTSGWSWALDRILAPRASYLLGIPSEPDSWDGQYHPIEIRVLRGDVRLFARRGYFAPTPDAR